MINKSLKYYILALAILFGLSPFANSIYANINEFSTLSLAPNNDADDEEEDDEDDEDDEEDDEDEEDEEGDEEDEDDEENDSIANDNEEIIKPIKTVTKISSKCLAVWQLISMNW